MKRRENWFQSKMFAMNDIDLNTLKMFASITLQYLAEDNEYDVTQLWQHLENARKLKERLNKLYPLIDTLINHPL